jgi:hypothetical protein
MESAREAHCGACIPALIDGSVKDGNEKLFGKSKGREAEKIVRFSSYVRSVALVVVRNCAAELRFNVL